VGGARRLGLPDPVEYADLATIGTIADVAPLLGENRALVKLGLARLRASSWPGVRATLALARLPAAPTARDVAFGLAPRLNAAGRMGEADLGLGAAHDGVRGPGARDRGAARRAQPRTQAHHRRDARERPADGRPRRPRHRGGRPDWHPGVMGLVASQLVERFFRPVYIVAGARAASARRPASPPWAASRPPRRT
jgi:single-stranded-DNA-specific exonuclease